jgi:uncharacterized protein involved in outer membrane biogenesis
VRARDVRLVSGSGAEYPNTELLKVRKLDLKLARSPFHKGPLVIENITVHDPEVHLIRTAAGRLVGMHDLVRPDSPTARATTQPELAATRPSTGPVDIAVESREEAEQDAARAKLSDMFQLRHFGITGALVARQPFGGFGLSGVGAKAGGPHYLLQFTDPRAVTENTLRRGFAPTDVHDSGA